MFSPIKRQSWDKKCRLAPKAELCQNRFLLDLECRRKKNKQTNKNPDPLDSSHPAWAQQFWRPLAWPQQCHAGLLEVQQLVALVREIKAWKRQWFVPYGDWAVTTKDVFGAFFVCSLNLRKAVWGGLFVCFGMLFAFWLHCFHCSTSCRNKILLKRRIWNCNIFFSVQWVRHLSHSLATIF